MKSLNQSFVTLLAAALLAVGVLTACSDTKIATADEQFDRGEYFDASRSYRQIYNKLNTRTQRQLKGEIALKMAECHRMLGQDARAATAYQNALRFGAADSSIVLRVAQMQMGQGMYPQVISTLSGWLESHPADPEAAHLLSAARKALEIKQRGSRYIVRQANAFNTSRADFSPMLQGETLYLSSTSERSKGEKKSEITGTKRADVWSTTKDELGRWRTPAPVEGELNTDWDEGVCSFSSDGLTMYLTRAVRNPNADSGTKIWTSQRLDAQWSAPTELEVDPDSTVSVGHPAISPSGEWLYFTSDSPKGNGGKDIWRKNLKEPMWPIENLGPAINTPGDEMFPAVRSDSVIYFASDGHAGLGGLDIFKATLSPSGGWRVENMGSPINSEGDDFGITFEPGREAGFFSSNRGDARGYDHIFSFVLPDIKVTISGYVVDTDEEPIANAVVRIVGKDGSNQKAFTKADGSFQLPLDLATDYVMLAGAEGFLNARQEFTTDAAEQDAAYSIDFILASLTKPNVVENIFYDYDKATLRPESRTALDSLAQLLRDNPAITIEMGSHTDRHGSDAYNEGLAQRRAQSVVDYLISVGIAPERLEPKGYGESQPKVVTKRVAREFPQFPEGQQLTEEYILTLPEELQQQADQINRRTEFTVTSLTFLQ